MSPQSRTALVSLVAAGALLTLKLVTGILTGSLGLVAEAIHSGTDLVAAFLTLVAVGVAVRPADRAHPYGHGKAEHLGALAEAAILVLVSLFVAGLAVARLVDGDAEVNATWWALLVAAVVIVVDASRMLVSLRAARRYESAALQANALHFASDLAGTTAVLFGLLAARAGYPEGDSIAALFVALLVLGAAGRLIRHNVDVLMDRVPADVEATARRAIAGVDPPVELRRLRVRQAGGKVFADVVIGVAQAAAVAQGHAAADAVEGALHDALPRSDVTVHVEPVVDEALVRERAHAAALHVPQVREIHNVNVLHVDGALELSLHLKLPPDLPLERAHAVATDVERAIVREVPEIAAVQTHLEPLADPGEGTPAAAGDVRRHEEAVIRVVREETGSEPRELRFLQTADGLVAFLTLGLDPASALADAHARASEIEARIRRERPDIAELIVHTEP